MIGDPYASVSELKRYASIQGTANDFEVDQAVKAASRSIESATHRQFNTSGTVTARAQVAAYEGVIYVDDIATNGGLILATDEDADGTYETTWAATDYQLEPLGGIVDGIPGWPYTRIRAVSDARLFPRNRFGRATVRVTADWGWPDVPDPIKSAALILAEEIYKMKDAPFGVAGFGEYGMLRVKENPKVAGMIAPYVRTPIFVAAA